jgi:hypothetical protein
VSGLRGVLHSYRWRRRFAWLGVFAALALGVALVIVLLPGSPKSLQSEPTGASSPQTTVAIPKPTQVTAAERLAVDRTLGAFVKSAVTRTNPAAAWDLVTEEMKGGVSRKEWNSGSLPVAPFPAQVPKRLSWKVLSSYADDLTLDLLLQPRQGTNRGAIAFEVEMQKAKGRWLVASMVPEHIFSPAPAPASTKPVATTPNSKTVAAPENPFAHGSLSLWWLAVPAALLALIVIIPLGVMLNSWRRNRAFEKRYRAERGL